MTPNHPETTGPARQPVFHKVGENLYRLESSDTYYALIKRGGKQIRRRLKTTDAALVRRRLADLRKKVGRLNQTPVKPAGSTTGVQHRQSRAI